MFMPVKTLAAMAFLWLLPLRHWCKFSVLVFLCLPGLLDQNGLWYAGVHCNTPGAQAWAWAWGRAQMGMDMVHGTCTGRRTHRHQEY